MSSSQVRKRLYTHTSTHIHTHAQTNTPMHIHTSMHAHARNALSFAMLYPAMDMATTCSGGGRAPTAGWSALNCASACSCGMLAAPKTFSDRSQASSSDETTVGAALSIPRFFSLMFVMALRRKCRSSSSLCSLLVAQTPKTVKGDTVCVRIGEGVGGGH